MRRSHVIAAVILAVVLTALAALAPDQPKADGNLQRQPIPISNDFGNESLPFNVACSTFEWTVLTSSDSISRGSIYQWDKFNVLGVCLATTTAIGDTCSSTTPGVMLSSAAISLTDYSKVGWKCRAESFNVAAQRIRGFRLRDRGDYGAIQWPDH